MTVFTDKAIKYVPRLQKDLDLSERFMPCGMFGNFGGETGGFKYLQEIKPTVAGSRGGTGWKQWTGPRRRAYEAWCKQNKLNPADDEANYRYVVWEGLNTEKLAISKLRQTKTLEEATEVYMKLDLRPGTPHLEGRVKWAKQAYDATNPSAIKPMPKGAIAAGTVSGVTAGTVVAIQNTTPDWLPYIMYGSIGIISTIVIVYIVHKYIQYRKLNTNG